MTARRPDDTSCSPAVAVAVPGLPVPLDPPAALASLRLTADDYEALRAQGFVSAEDRGGRRQYRLRFRRTGRQVVRYIGTDAGRAQDVQRELDVLQAERRSELSQARTVAAARRLLRQLRLALVPCLDAWGYAYHGTAIRRRRQPRGRTPMAATNQQPRVEGDATPE